MKREIKFKLYEISEDDPSHVDVSYIVWENGKFVVEPSLLQCKCPKHVRKLAQFTGLFDKNNKPIYEGDIVHYIEDYIQEDLVKWSDGVVEYSGSAFTIDGRGSLDQWGTLEVIGDIYSNPELLQESHEQK